jgi:hypothetical protein
MSQGHFFSKGIIVLGIFAVSFFGQPIFALEPLTSPGQEGPGADAAASHLLEVLKQGGVSAPADASKFNGTVKIGGYSESFRGALQVGNSAVAQLSDIQGAMANNAIAINVPTHRANYYFPGLVWSTGNDNPTKPKIAIWGQMTASGSRMYLGTSNESAKGITNTAVTIDENGRVGIGKSTNIQYALDVNGIVNATQIYKNGAPLSTSQWITNGSSIYYSAGNVGIGTANPQGKFVVIDDSLYYEKGYLQSGQKEPRCSFDKTNSEDTPSTTTTGLVLGATCYDVYEHWAFKRYKVGSQYYSQPYIVSQRADTNFIVSSQGNVGIGTAVPQGRFTVSNGGRIMVYKSDSDKRGLDMYWHDSGYGYISAWNWSSNGFQPLRISGNPLILNDYTGNVGIGTTNPSRAKLEVQGSGGLNAIFGPGGSGVALMNDWPGVGLNMYWSPAGPRSITSGYGGSLWVSPYDGRFEVRLNSRATGANVNISETRPFTILNSGNVGIGTISPTQKLDISGDVRILGTAGYYAANHQARLLFGNTDSAGGNITGIMAQYGYGLKFGVYKYYGRGSFGTQSFDAMVIREKTGNVGIGTDDPLGKLHVQSDQTYSFTGSTYEWKFPICKWDRNIWKKEEPPSLIDPEDVEKTVCYDWYWKGGNPYFIAYEYKIAPIPALVVRGGYVGIGTANPSAKLEVAGQVKITGGDPGAGKVLTTDSTGLASWKNAPTSGYENLPNAGVWSQWRTAGDNIYYRYGSVGIGTQDPGGGVGYDGGALLDLRGPRGRLADNGIRWQAVKNPDDPGPEFIAKAYVGDYNETVHTTPLIFTSAVFMPSTQTTYPEVTLALLNGRVGIGTKSPSALLEVAGQVKITGGSPGAGKVLVSDESGFASWGAPPGGSQWTSETSGATNYKPVIYYNGGNVGIGTNSPRSKLWVYANSGGGDSQLSIGHTAVAQGGQVLGKDLSLGYDFVSNIGLIQTHQFGLDSYPSNLSLQPQGGYVGIGTRWPKVTLDVLGKARASQFCLGGDSNMQCIESWPSAASGAASQWTTTGSDIYYSTGKVAIGTQIHSGVLTVQGGGGGGTIRLLPNPDDGESSINFKRSISGTDVGWTLGQGSYGVGAGNFGIGKDSLKFSILDNGNVGIGITNQNQSAKLEVNAASGEVMHIKGSQTEVDVRFLSSNGDWQVGTNNSGNGTDNNQFFIYDTAYRLTVQKGTGNVGIGTINPDQKLVINEGGIGFAGPGLRSSDKKLYSPADGLLEWRTHDDAGESAFAVSHVGRKRVYLNTDGASYLNGGSVGIGTTTPCPDCMLDVRGGDINVQAFFGENRFVELPEKTRIAYETDRVGLDVAELFETNEDVEVGDIVVVANEERKLAKSGSQYQDSIVGIVSGAPAILFEGSQLKMGANPNRFERGTRPPVALAGRIPVKVSLENGSIKPGDYLTSSSKPGVAMKATEPGMTIGVALEHYDDEDVGKILVFLNLGEKNTSSVIKEFQQYERETKGLLKSLERRLRILEYKPRW